MTKKQNEKLQERKQSNFSENSQHNRRNSEKSPSEQAIFDRIRGLSSNPLSKSDDAGSGFTARSGKNRKAKAKTAGNLEKISLGIIEKEKEKEKKKDKRKELGAAVSITEPAKKPQAPKHKREGNVKLRVLSLGGIGEIGKNLTVLECNNDMIIVDCGLGFPDDDMPGVDLVIPDFSYLEANRDKLRGLLLTHGHEDHIGGVPYLLRALNIPVYGTPLTLKIIENKLHEFRLPWEANLKTVNAGDTVKLGCFSAEFIRVNHSIADACCLSIGTPLGTVIHTGDFKLDLTPIEGEIMNITRLGEIGNKGVKLLLCESTNAERQGYTPSESTVGKSLEYIFTTNGDKRIVISTFSSNVHRVQQVIDASQRHGRKVVITGRSMINIIRSAIELGYMKIEPGTLIDVGDIKRYRPSELTVVCTGSQGEPMSALYRMAFGDKTQIVLDQNDVVLISASAIPGNEKTVGKIINELCRRGIGVLNDPSFGVHVSGHACQEELKLMTALTKPQYFMPIHGEARHLQANRQIARQMNIEDRNIFVGSIGQVLEIDKKGARFAGTVPSGNVLVDGTGVGEVGEIVLRDRRMLSQDGLVIVFTTLDENEKLILSKPEVVSRGFVYMRESEALMEEVRNIATDAVSSYLNRCNTVDRVQLKGRIRDEVARFLFRKTKRKPMVLPVIMSL